MYLKRLKVEMENLASVESCFLLHSVTSSKNESSQENQC